MKRSLLLFIIIISMHAGQSQVLTATLASPYLSTGVYKDTADVYSFSANQASLARMAHFSASVYGSKLFFLNELSYFSAALIMPTSSGVFGMQLNHFGNSHYGEMASGLAYGRKLSEKLDAGVQFTYHALQLSGYGSAGALSFEGGLLFHFTQQWQGGIHIVNPMSVRFGKEGAERLPAAYSMGFGYEPSKSVSLSAVLEKTEGRAVALLSSIEYKLADQIIAKGGMATGNGVYFLGAGVLLKSFQLHAVFSVHPQLGVTPGLLLAYKPMKN